MNTRTERPITSHPRTHIPLGPITLGEAAVVWRLVKGGLAISEAVKVAGVKGNTNAIAGIVNTLDTALTDSLPLAGSVRCKHCRGRIVSVPCIVCGPDHPAYMVSSYGEG